MPARSPDLRLQVVFALLFVLSFFLSEKVGEVLPTWFDPKVGLMSCVIGVLWMGSLLLDRLRSVEDQNKVLRDLVDRHENKIRALEEELARRA